MTHIVWILFSTLIILLHFFCGIFKVQDSWICDIRFSTDSLSKSGLHFIFRSQLNSLEQKTFLFGWDQSIDIRTVSSIRTRVCFAHTGLICFRSFHNYAFKGWLSLETMKLWLFLVTKPLFLKTLIIKLTLGNIFIKVKNPPGGATVTK